MQQSNWARFCDSLCVCSPGGLSLDISRMDVPDSVLTDASGELQRAFEQMDALEAGAIANPDENRMVGHYWLRTPELSPTDDIRKVIQTTVAAVRSFAGDVHAGRVHPPSGGRFENVLVIGIGGSALGPQLLADALAPTPPRLSPCFFDNTDPDGFARTLARIGTRLDRTLTLVISKSGGTKETRNGMIAAANAYRAAGLDFAKHAVAVTGEGSQLSLQAAAESWMTTFPMWDWVGGRTSTMSAVGLLPAALMGIDIDGLLAGAKDMDAATRVHDVRRNPAALLAVMWRYTAWERGIRDLVILPYKDRLELFGRYLQQLIMESLGKERDLAGNVVHEGLTVYGNKGSTDQHAYVQQLRDGLHNFMVTFIQVLNDGEAPDVEVEPGITAGDYLHGFLLGTRDALDENERKSMTICLRELSPRSLGALIALFERAVGLYAFMAHINAYHQPGVEAGKVAATEILAIQRLAVEALIATAPKDFTAEQLAVQIGRADATERLFKILEHLAANPRRGIHRSDHADPRQTRFHHAP